MGSPLPQAPKTACCLDGRSERRAADRGKSPSPTPPPSFASPRTCETSPQQKTCLLTRSQKRENHFRTRPKQPPHIRSRAVPKPDPITLGGSPSRTLRSMKSESLETIAKPCVLA